jgi:hypothetical protein
VQEFKRNIGAVGKGVHITYGGAHNDLANGRVPKDYDSYLHTTLHPMAALDCLEKWATAKGYEVENYPGRIRLLWKRLKIRVDGIEFDISCVQSPMPVDDFVRMMADDADVSPCARSGTAESAYQSQRCSDGEKHGQLIWRGLIDDRTRFRHLDRWIKYAIAKYPDREIVYQHVGDTEVFAPMNALRKSFAALRQELVEQDLPAAKFEAYRPLMPEFFDNMLAAMRAAPVR